MPFKNHIISSTHIKWRIIHNDRYDNEKIIFLICLYSVHRTEKNKK